MANNLFKGIVQITEQKFTAQTFTASADTIYFVRTDTAGKEGYLYLNGRKYGNMSELKTAVDGLKNSAVQTIETGSTYVKGDVTYENNLNQFYDVLDGGKLAGNISLEYDADSYTLKLIGKTEGENKTVVTNINLSNLAQDKVLDSVEILDSTDIVTKDPNFTGTGKYIVFTWNTEGMGPTYLAVNDIATYAGTSSIEIADNQISVKVKATSTDTPNFLTVTDDGLLVSGVTANKTITSGEITIAGGPLAEEVINAGIFADNKIPKGTDVMDILTKLFCKEIYPSTTSHTGSVSVSNPSINPTRNLTTKTIDNKKYVKKGTTVQYTYTAKNINVTPTNSRVNGLTYGYSSSLEGEIIEENTKSITPQTTIEGNYTLTLTNNSVELTSATPSVNASSVSITHDVEFGEGANTIKITQNGPDVNYTIGEIPPLYIVSNLGNKVETKQTTQVNAVATTTKSPSAAVFSETIYGAYSVLSNGVITSDSSFKLSTPNPNTTELANTFAVAKEVFTVGLPAQETNPWVIMLPEGGVGIESAFAFNASSGKYDGPITFNAEGPVEVVGGVSYTPYVATGTNGASVVKVTLQ